MKSANSEAGDGFYFALPRLWQRLRDRGDEVSENNVIEAYVGSIGAFIVTLLWASQVLADGLSGWKFIALALLLVLAVWIFWLLVFYINSLVIKVLQRTGLFRSASNRDAQDVLIGIVVAGLAYQLSILPSGMHYVGILYLIALGLNLMAALLLTLIPSPK
jgi:hypothetical protein